MLRRWFMAGTACSLLALAGGCGGGHDSHDGHKHEPGDDHGKQESGKQADIERDGLAKLDAADRKLALAQKMCPVSGEELGSMGVPPKATARGETVFLCCTSCLKKLNADPQKYLAEVAKLRDAQ